MKIKVAIYMITQFMKTVMLYNHTRLQQITTKINLNVNSNLQEQN